MFYSIETVPKKVPARFLELPERFTPSLSCYKLLLTRRSQFPLFRRAGGTVLFCVHGAQRAFGEQAECTQNKTEPAALAAATGNRKGAVAPLQCQGVWGRNAPNNTRNSFYWITVVVSAIMSSYRASTSPLSDSVPLLSILKSVERTRTGPAGHPGSEACI